MAWRVKRLCGYSGLNWPLITDSEIQSIMGKSTFHWEWSITEESSAQKASPVEQPTPDKKPDSSEDTDELDEPQKSTFSYSV